MPRPEHSNRADIYIAHTPLEWQMAKAIGRALHARGYVVAPTKMLEQPGPQVVPILSADAGAVIVIWPIAPTEFGVPALELEARAAAQRGNLVQVYAGLTRPAETYAGPAPIDFKAWDPAVPGRQFRALLARLRPLCGPPRAPVRRPPPSMPNAVLLGTLAVALGVICMALGQSGRHKELRASPSPSIAPPVDSEAGIAMNAVGVRRNREDDANFAAEPNRGSNIGGLEDGYEKDLGVDPADTRVAPPPAPPPAPVQRPPQGPER